VFKARSDCSFFSSIFISATWPTYATVVLPPPFASREACCLTQSKSVPTVEGQHASEFIVDYEREPSDESTPAARQNDKTTARGH
jgi:hypothetical protein